MQNSMMLIGRLARETGCSIPTIRYYEDIRLIEAAERNTGGHRIYESRMVETLRFIRRCREFGFPIEEIRELIPALHKGSLPCASARDAAEKHLVRLEKQMKELRALRLSLAGLVESCLTECKDGTSRECTMYRELRSASLAS